MLFSSGDDIVSWNGSTVDRQAVVAMMTNKSPCSGPVAGYNSSLSGECLSNLRKNKDLLVVCDLLGLGCCIDRSNLVASYESLLPEYKTRVVELLRDLIFLALRMHDWKGPAYPYPTFLNSTHDSIGTYISCKDLLTRVKENRYYSSFAMMAVDDKYLYELVDGCVPMAYYTRLLLKCYELLRDIGKEEVLLKPLYSSITSR
jgi:hypothetical protein